MQELREWQLNKMKRRNRRNNRKRKLDKARIVAKLMGVIDQDQWANKMADNLRSCSCEMCKSPRKSGWCKGNLKLTKQELFQINDFSEAQ